MRVELMRENGDSKSQPPQMNRHEIYSNAVGRSVPPGASANDALSRPQAASRDEGLFADLFESSLITGKPSK